jgi:L-arabinose isomerase
MRLRRKTVVGHYGAPQVQERIGTWTRAACGWHEAHGLRVARFGDNMRQVAVTEGDKVEAQARLGFAVNGYGVNELVDRVAAVGDAAVDDLVDAYDDAYDVAVTLRRGGDRHAELRTAARSRRPAVVHGGRRLRGVHRHVGTSAGSNSCPDGSSG